MGTPPSLTAADVDRYRSSLSNWGRWGDADQLGTLNLLRPEHTIAAAALVRTGRRVSCSRPLPTEPAVDNLRPVEHHMVGTVTEGYGADWFGLAPHGYATSHLDALCHIFWEGRLYGDRPAGGGHRPRGDGARHPPARATASWAAACCSTFRPPSASTPSSRARPSPSMT